MNVETKENEKKNLTTSSTTATGNNNSDSDKRVWKIGTGFLVIICLLLLVLVIVYATKDFKPATGALESPSYSYCQTWDECVTTPEEFEANINHTSGFFGPACVGNNMMGRMIPRPGLLDTTWQPTTVRNSGRFSFAIGPEMLSKILVIGSDKATNIVKELGYGDDYVCGTEAENYQDCQYRLLVWSVPCPRDKPPLTQAFWDNLEPFLRGVYGDKTPNLTSAINTIRESKGLLKNFTGCDPLLLNGANGRYWELPNQESANCSQEFKDAMASFNNNTCVGTDPYNPNYINSTTNGCLAEEAFLAIKNPTAVQLRAYLMQTEGFNPFYTGYGYTSNNDYFDPSQQEFWYPNKYVTDLPSYTIITIRNGTAFT